MMKSLHIAKTGLEAQQTQLDVISNNLANASTNGFKRSRAVFEDLLYQTMREAGTQNGEGAQVPTGLQVGTGSKVVATVKNFSQGTLELTGNQFDLAINGKGFFQVTMPDGTTGYTRDGSFQTDSEGRMVTSNGYPLQGVDTVPVNAESVTVSPEGEVTAKIAGQVELQNLGQIELATFVNMAGLANKGGNIYQETVASGEATSVNPTDEGSGNLVQFYVEGSNVNVVEELVGLIQTQRAYEINSKAISTSDQMLQRISQM